MTKTEVIYNRDLIKSLTYDVKNEDGSMTTMITPIAIFGSNNFNIVTDYHDGSFIWNDDKETIFFFQWNSQVEMNSPAPAMSVGAQIKAPCYIGFMPYNEIITMRAVLIEETFEKVCNKLGITGDAKKYLHHKYFIEPNQEYQIKQKRKLGISYNNQHSREYNKDKYFSEMDEYNKTIHPTIL